MDNILDYILIDNIPRVLYALHEVLIMEGIIFS